MGVYKQMDECEGEIIEGLTDEYNIDSHDPQGFLQKACLLSLFSCF